MAMGIAQDIPEYKLRSERISELPFKLESIDKHNGYNPRAPHRHNYYEIFLFQQGGGMHMIDFHEMQIESGSVHFLSPGQIHFMHRHPEANGYVLKFTPDFFLSNLRDKDTLDNTPFLNNKIVEPMLILEREDFAFLWNMLMGIKTEWELKRSGYLEMIKNYLNLMIIQCERHYSPGISGQNSSEADSLIPFKNLLDKHYLGHYKVSFYSEKLDISDEKLSQICKNASGKTPSELMSERILLEAKRLLLHSNKSIKEVAYELNFQDNAYFARWFKKLANLSPGDFRKEYKNRYTSGPGV